MPQLEGSTVRIYNYVLGGFGEKKQRKKNIGWGQPCGRGVKFARSTLVAQGFAGSDPACRHGTAHQATSRWRPTCHNWKDPQLKNLQLCTRGIWGEKAEKKKNWQQLLAQVPIFKKKEKRLATDVSSGAKLKKKIP